MIFTLFPDIEIVLGAKNALLIDFRGKNYLSMDKEYGEFLAQRKIDRTSLSADEIEFLEYLQEKDYGMFCEDEEADCFEQINSSWDHPASITNAIIEVSSINLSSALEFVSQLGKQNCEHIELRLIDTDSFQFLNKIFRHCGEFGVHGVELVVPYHADFGHEKLLEISNDHEIYLYRILIHSAPIPKDSVEMVRTTLVRIKKRSLTCLDCGSISQSNFIVDIPFYTESMHFNNCLNRKISMDQNGQIKNCPSMKKEFGSTEETTIAQVLNDEMFTNLWTISKEHISVCKDCEFRRICTDCRAFISDSDNEMSKPAKCTYNPYKGVWEE